MKTTSKKTISFLLFLFTFCSATLAQLTPIQLDSLISRALNTFQVAGASVAVVKDGKVVHQKGYGVTSIKTGIPVTAETPFAIASNTKAFTTTALAILVEEGKLSWDDKVIKHIPEFTMYNPYVTQHFTVLDLLTHRSGLGLGVGDLMGFPDGGDFTIEDVLASFQHFEPVSEFRTQFDYDNLLYWVAGEVIARVSGMSWEAYITEAILKPLELNSSYASLKEIPTEVIMAEPHLLENGRLRQINRFVESVNGAAGGINASAADMARWMLVHLKGGVYGEDTEKSLFSKKSQREMWKIHTVLDTRPDLRYNTHFAGYGLGWFLTDVSGYLSVNHTGGLPGMLSKTWMIPDLNVGVVVLTNTSDSGGAFFSAVSKTIVDSYLDVEPMDWVTFYKERFSERQQEGDEVTEAVWKQVAANKKTTVNSEMFTGTYEDVWFGKVTIYDEGKSLRFRAHRSPKLKGELFFYKANTFAIKWDDRDLQADAFASFVLDEEGRATEIRMKGISPNIDFSYDFQDLKLKRQEVEK